MVLVYKLRDSVITLLNGLNLVLHKKYLRCTKVKRPKEREVGRMTEVVFNIESEF